MPRYLAIVSLAALAACAQATETVNSDVTTQGLQDRTASYFNTYGSNVQIVSYRQSVVGTAYKARVSGRLYDCKYFRSAITCNRAL